MKLLCIFVVSCTTVIVGASSRPTEISSSASLPASNHGHHHFDPVVNAIIEPSSDAVSVAYPNGNDGDNTPAFLRGIMLVATGNLLLNIFRPDPVIVWQFKLPRLLWELNIVLVAATAISSNSPMIYLLISFMLASTAIVDIFVWAPFFAFLAGVDNQDCTGGWFTGQKYVCRPNHVKGYGRLLVTAQSLLSGLFYMASAISAWGEYVAHRDRTKAIRQAHFLHSLRHERKKQKNSFASSW